MPVHSKYWVGKQGLSALFLYKQAQLALPSFSGFLHQIQIEVSTIAPTKLS